MTPWGGTAAVAAGAFLALGLVAGAGVGAPERALYNGIAGLGTPALIDGFRWLSLLGAKAVLLPAALLLALPASQFRRRWWLLPATVLAAAGLEDIAKIAVGRPRPAAAEPGFPSGHATAAAAFSVSAAALTAERLTRAAHRIGLWTLAATCTVLASLARIVLARHWPLDVAAGACLGLAVAAAALAWHRAHPPRT